MAALNVQPAGGQSPATFQFADGCGPIPGLLDRFDLSEGAIFGERA
jgi:hypothetical protein